MIYVVMGSTGEYSDRTEWPVSAFREQAAAAELVASATARAKAIELTRPNRYTASPETNEFDPGMDMDYTGTSYYIMPVDLVEP